MCNKPMWDRPMRNRPMRNRPMCNRVRRSHAQCYWESASM
jgi:hypothetical protein